jgi:hypothetical protein
MAAKKGQEISLFSLTIVTNVPMSANIIFSKFKLPFKCQTVFYFARSGGGGAFMLLLMLSTTFFSVQLAGQTLETLDCSELDIVVCQRAQNIPPNPTCVGCAVSPVDCHRMQYEVKLRAAPNVVAGNSFQLKYTDLEIATNLAFTGANSGMTRVNVNETQAVCPGGSIVFADGVTNTAGIKFSTTGGAGPVVTFSRTIPNTHFFATLFTVVVDIFPNDMVELDCSFFRYADGDLVTCFYADVDYIDPSPNILILADDLNVKFGLNPAVLGATSATVPITITSTQVKPLIMHYVDFQFTVQSTAPIPPPTTQNAAGYAIDVSPATGLHTNYKVIVRRTGGVLNFAIGETKVLFNLVVQRPSPQNTQSTIVIDYLTGRFEGQIISPPSSFCRRMVKGPTGIQSIPFTGDPICGNSNLSLNVTGIPGGTSGNCGDLFVSVDLGIPPNSQVRELRFVLDFDLSNGAFIDVANIQNQLPCNLGNNLSACTDRVGVQECYSVTGNKLTYCFKTSGHEVFNGGTLLIPVSAESACINAVTVSEAAMYLIGQGTVTCVPDVNVNGFYLCSREISGTVKYGPPDDTGCWVEEVAVDIIPTNNACPDVTVTTSCPVSSNNFAPTPYAYCVCDEGTYEITPKKDDNPLNGLTTYDLVLISKHILGVEPFDNPYKMIAADANKSGSVTTFDIIEFRKLILGTYNSLPGNTSWRFVPKELDFINPLNPFQGSITFPELITAEIDNTGIEYAFDYADGFGNPATLNSTAADFAGIKVGDVNCTAVPCGNAGTCPGCGTFPQRPANPNEYFALEMPALSAKAGEVFILPVYAGSEHPLIAYQAGLSFDPARFELMSFSAGEIIGFTPDCLNLSEITEGKIKVLWLSFDHESNYLQPGQVLFYVALRAISEVQEREQILATDDAVFQNLGFTADHKELPLQATQRSSNGQRGQAPGTSLAASCAPNPTSGAVELSLVSELPVKARVAVFGPFGVRMYYRELELSKGINRLPIRETADWPAGIYTWQVQAGKEKITDRFVKQ